MSTFWSRSRHVTSSCRCTLCNPSRSAIPRRLNVNTAPARQQPAVSDAVTIFYGTVMAAALYTDASIKIGKRRQLEKNIDQAKDEAQALEDSNRERLEALGLSENSRLTPQLATPTEESLTTQISHENDGGRKLGKARSTTKVEYWKRRLQRHLEEENRATSPDLKSHFRLEAKKAQYSLKITQAKVDGGAVYDAFRTARKMQLDMKAEIMLKEKKLHDERTLHEAEKHRAELRHHLLSPIATLTEAEMQQYPLGSSARELWQEHSKEPQNPYYIKRQELALSLLIYRLLEHASSKEQTKDLQSMLRNSENMRDIELKDIGGLITDTRDQLHYVYRFWQASDNEIEQLATTTLVRLIQQKDRRAARLQQNEVNHSLCKVFQSKDANSSLIVQICDVIAGMKSSPDVHMFNILLVNFTRLQFTSAARMAIGALLQCGKFSNGITMAALLRIYSAPGFGNRFRQTVSEMDALDGKGILSSNKFTNPRMDQSSHGKLQWPNAAYMDINGQFSTKRRQPYLRINRNEDIYNTLVVGLVENEDFEAAGKELARMLHHGIVPSTDAVNALLHQAVLADDPELGNTISRWVLDGSAQGSKNSLRETVYLMAQLACLKTPLSNEGSLPLSKDTAFDAINKFALDQGLISQALDPTHFNILSKHEKRTAQKRSSLIRRLEQPILSLRFEEDGTLNDTAPISEDLPFVNDQQPVNLIEYLSAYLRLTYKNFVLRSGPILAYDKVARDTLGLIETNSKYLEFGPERSSAAKVDTTVKDRKRARRKSKKSEARQATIENQVQEVSSRECAIRENEIVMNEEAEAATEVVNSHSQQATSLQQRKPIREAGKIATVLPGETAHLKKSMNDPSSQKWMMEGSQPGIFAG